MTTSQDPTRPQFQTRTLSTKVLLWFLTVLGLMALADVGLDLLEACHPRFTADRVYCTR